MAKLEKNRAQRRREKRRSITHTPSFWTTTQGKITAGVFGAAIIAFVVYGFWPKTKADAPTSKPASTASTTPPKQQPAAPQQPPVPPPDPNAKLVSKDIKVGTGAEAKTGDTVSVAYTGKLTNGTTFDSSVDKGMPPYTFVLGAGTVIKGWEQGIVGMKVGGKRHLSIPPALGYGSQDKGNIPPNSTLEFDVELTKVEPKASK